MLAPNPTEFELYFEPETAVHTNRLALGVYTALGGLSYWLSTKHAFPDFQPPFDMNEHGKHIIGGEIIGYPSAMVLATSSFFKKHSKVFSFLACSTVACWFETRYNTAWYRNTTLDPVDAIYTMASSMAAISMVETEPI